MSNNPNSNQKSQALAPGSILTVNTTRTRGTKFLLNQMLLEKQQKEQHNSQATPPGSRISTPVYACSPVTRFIKIVPPVNPPENCNIALPKKKKRKKAITLTQHLVEIDPVQNREDPETDPLPSKEPLAEEVVEKENSEELNNSILLPFGRKKKRKRKRKKKDCALESPTGDEAYEVNMDESRDIIAVDLEGEEGEDAPEKHTENIRVPLYYESKDTKGKNKSTKNILQSQVHHNIPTNKSHSSYSPKNITPSLPQASTTKAVPLTQVDSSLSSQNSSEIQSTSSPSSIVLSSDTPPPEVTKGSSGTSELSTGTQTQAIFQNKEYQGHGSAQKRGTDVPSLPSPEVLVYCSGSESDNPEHGSSAKTSKHIPERKRTATRKESKKSPKRRKEATNDEVQNVITVNIDESSPEEQHQKDLASLNTKSVAPVDKNTLTRKITTSQARTVVDTNTPKMKPESSVWIQKATRSDLMTPSHMSQPFPEISPCSEAECSPLLPASQSSAFQTPRNRGKLTKLSLSQRKKIPDILSQDSGSPALAKVKRKLDCPTPHNISEGFMPSCSPESENSEVGQSVGSKKLRVRFWEKDDDDNEDVCVLKLQHAEPPAVDDVSSMSLLGTVPETSHEKSPVATTTVPKTFQPRHTSTQIERQKKKIAQEAHKGKETVKVKETHPRNIIPETSESSEQASSSSSLAEMPKITPDARKSKKEETRNIRLRSDSIKERVCAKEKAEKKGSESACLEGDSQSKNSSESSELSRTSENPSTDSSASTEMLRPVGKTCLQSIVYVLQTHFGGTLTESFNVLHRNSFNLLTSIMELQTLHPEVEDALYGDEEEEEEDLN
ncbi:uncharacterized protein LOC134781904 [Penaeus indicus]|uniref:uncharacterized protein LOC134781904 n=1 Tax=Penaeus indicus TaxID=29960 RepID=UPI00300D4A85